MLNFEYSIFFLVLTFTPIGITAALVIQVAVDLIGNEIQGSLLMLSEACVLWIGLTWEKAFMKAAKFSTYASEANDGIKLFEKIIICTVVLFTVMPAWLWYVYPKAAAAEKKGRADHPDEHVTAHGEHDANHVATDLSARTMTRKSITSITSRGQYDEASAEVAVVNVLMAPSTDT